MDATLPIPDDLASRLGSPADVSRRALEAFVAQEHRAGRLTPLEVRRLLGQADAVGEQQGRALLAEFQAFRADKSLDGLDPGALIRDGASAV